MDPVDIASAAGALAANKLLGPTFELYGQEIRRLNEEYISKRRNNVGRIFKKAEKKLGDRIDEDGSVHPKVLKEILDDGSFAEDELAAEYFGGVLASSRTGVDRDDRGAVFAKVIARLSVYQLRTHYIFYSHLKCQFNGSTLSLGLAENRRQLSLFIPAPGYVAAMEFGEREEVNSILGHVLFGLIRETLIDEHSEVSKYGSLKEVWPDATSDGLVLTPSMTGVELFLWAHGQGHVPYSQFLNPATIIESDIDIPIIGGVMPRFTVSN